jgi:hypothetical protein
MSKEREIGSHEQTNQRHANKILCATLNLLRMYSRHAHYFKKQP